MLEMRPNGVVRLVPHRQALEFDVERAEHGRVDLEALGRAEHVCDAESCESVRVLQGLVAGDVQKVGNDRSGLVVQKVTALAGFACVAGPVHHSVAKVGP